MSSTVAARSPDAGPAQWDKPRRPVWLRRALGRLLFGGPVGWLTRRRAFRWLVTAGFRSGRIAFGERNGYLIPPRWVTIDLFGADFNLDVRAGDRLPFPDGSQRVVYSAHTIEHLDDRALEHLLTECHRVLRPGGHIRLETPDAERVVQAYLDEDDWLFDYFQADLRKSLVIGLGLPEVYAERHNALVGLFSCYLDRGRHAGALASREEVDRRVAQGDLDAFGAWCVSLQTPEQRASGGHVNALYFDKLERMLEQAGFREVKRKSNGLTEVPDLSLRLIERSNVRAWYSLYVEAAA